jgi:hypothetical protein
MILCLVLLIEQMRDSIYTTAVIPTDDAVKHGFKPAVTNNLGSGATQADDDPELFRWVRKVSVREEWKEE